MTTLTIELPDKETELFKQLLKKLNGKVVSIDKIPNRATIAAINELKDGKGIRFKNAAELFRSI